MTLFGRSLAVVVKLQDFDYRPFLCYRVFYKLYVYKSLGKYGQESKIRVRKKISKQKNNTWINGETAENHFHRIDHYLNAVQ